MFAAESQNALVDDIEAVEHIYEHLDAQGKEATWNFRHLSRVVVQEVRADLDWELHLVTYVSGTLEEEMKVLNMN